MAVVSVLELEVITADDKLSENQQFPLIVYPGGLKSGNQPDQLSTERAEGITNLLI